MSTFFVASKPPRAIRELLGNDVLYQWNHSLNNRLE